MEELIDIADRVAGWAHDGEEVEAFVVHEHETEIRAYEGDVESLTSAESQAPSMTWKSRPCFRISRSTASEFSRES